jgi:hypothetical protein
VLSRPPYFPDLVRADLFPTLKICIGSDEIRSCFNYPTDCDERTEDDPGKSFFGAFDSLYEQCKRRAEASEENFERW